MEWFFLGGGLVAGGLVGFVAGVIASRTRKAVDQTWHQQRTIRNGIEAADRFFGGECCDWNLPREQVQKAMQVLEGYGEYSATHPEPGQGPPCLGGVSPVGFGAGVGGPIPADPRFRAGWSTPDEAGEAPAGNGEMKH